MRAGRNAYKCISCGQQFWTVKAYNQHNCPKKPKSVTAYFAGTKSAEELMTCAMEFLVDFTPIYTEPRRNRYDPTGEELALSEVLVRFALHVGVPSQAPADGCEKCKLLANTCESLAHSLDAERSRPQE